MVETKVNPNSAQTGIDQAGQELQTGRFDRVRDLALTGAMLVGAVFGIMNALGRPARAETVERANALIAGGREDAAAQHVADSVDLKRALDAGPETVLAETSPGSTFEFHMGQNSPKVHKPGAVDPVTVTGYENVDGTPVKVAKGASLDSIAKFAGAIQEGLTLAEEVAGSVARFLPRR